jgi:hypothetical protein
VIGEIIHAPHTRHAVHPIHPAHPVHPSWTVKYHRARPRQIVSHAITIPIAHTHTAHHTLHLLSHLTHIPKVWLLKQQIRQPRLSHHQLLKRQQRIVRLVARIAERDKGRDRDLQGLQQSRKRRQRRLTVGCAGYLGFLRPA